MHEVETIPTKIKKPNGLTWGADFFWTLNKDRKRLIRIDTEHGKHKYYLCSRAAGLAYHNNAIWLTSWTVGKPIFGFAPREKDWIKSAYGRYGFKKHHLRSITGGEAPGLWGSSKKLGRTLMRVVPNFDTLDDIFQHQEP